MYEFWCGVILRDVRSAILTTHQNKYIFFHKQPITFLLHTRYYHKKLNIIYYIIFINKISKITYLSIEQRLKFKTKVTQLLPLTFLRLSRKQNVYSKEFHSKIWEHLQIFICILYVKNWFWTKWATWMTSNNMFDYMYRLIV